MSTAQSTAKLSPAQMRKIWATARELSLNAETLHDLVHGEGLGDHISQLSQGQAAYLIDVLEHSDRSGTFASPATVGKIWKLSFLIWGDGSDLARTETRRRLREWITRTNAVPQMFKHEPLKRLSPAIAANLLRSLVEAKARQDARLPSAEKRGS